MIKKYLIWLATVAVLAYLGYSVWYTYKVQPEKGIVVCVPAGEQKTFSYTTESGEKIEDTVSGGSSESCFWTAHIHATMDLTYCGSHLDLPKDKAILSRPHTHKELNKMHSPHARQPVDPVTKKFIDATPLTVAGFLDAIEIDIKTPCPGAKSSQAVLTVNGSPKALDYIWQDGDEIKVEYK